MIKSLPKLLIFGVTAPSRTNAAAATTQLALFFSEIAAVTLVISDSAAPPPAFPKAITVCRERDLRADQKKHKTSARLYVLGDTFESLSTLRLMDEAPGPFYCADATLHSLVKAKFETSAGWPNTYERYLHETLSDGGAAIAHALSAHRRASLVVETEISALDSVESADCKQVGPDNGLGPVPPIKTNEQSKTDLSSKTDSFTVVAVGEGAAPLAVETLQNLGKDISLLEMSGSEPNLASIIQSADAVCLLDKQMKMAPPALSLALLHGKALVTSAQPWTRHLPAATHLPIKTQAAHHQLVVALGSLLGESKVKQWLQSNAVEFWENSQTESLWQKFGADTLTHKTQPLILDSNEPVHTARKTATKAAKNPEIIDPSNIRPFALIGSVPPKNLIEQLFPSVNWSISPRFATPALAAILSKKTGKEQSVILARLGYESTLIADKSDSAQTDNSARSWADIKPALKYATEALSFECDITDVDRVHSLLPDGVKTPNAVFFDLASVVHENPLRQASDGFLEDMGLYWQLNRTEHRLDCLIIAGLAGDYSLSMQAPESCLIVADNGQTTRMDDTHAATLATNQQGILSFSVAAAHPVNFYPLPFGDLLKILANCPFNLEWLPHG